ncbi:MAG: DUF853 domain-containing protein [Eubacterium sp.]|nr:DUF853 domain-containing protein [Eubacterium sp.]
MLYDNKILIGKSGDEEIYIYPSMANRHGLIAGATGTGKTITLKVLAESFSDAGVPVFLADAKGDLAGMVKTGEMNDNVAKRVEKLSLDKYGYSLKAYPATFWDVFQENGLALRTTISEMGPLLLSRVLGLNDTQSDIMTIIFRIADDENLLLIDTKDLKAMLQHVGEKADEYSLKYGNMAKQSLAAITRSVAALEAAGGEMFFGEPAIDIKDWFIPEMDGRGRIEILDCQKLMQNPTMYATFMLWLISELFEALPEAGDLDKPKMVFFFDEAHMLFDDAPKALMSKIEQLVKLIRSKGVGIYFVTQSPRDIPDAVLAQLGNKIQHALRAYTPAEQKNIKAAAQSFRENPEINTVDALQALGTGEALISVLDEDGVPTIVKQAKILPPQSKMGAIDVSDRNLSIMNDKLNYKYKDFVDRDSAFEFLQRRAEVEEKMAALEAEKLAMEKERLAREKEAEKERQRLLKEAEKERERREREYQKQLEREEREAEKERERRQKEMDKFGRKVTQSFARGLFSTFMRR